MPYRAILSELNAVLYLYGMKGIKVKLTVEYSIPGQKGSNDFYNLQDLKKWLDKNPAIAAELGYIKKAPK